MLASKRSRGRVLVRLLLAGLVLTAVVWAAGNRAYESERDDLVDEARAKLGATTTAEAYDLWNEEIVDTGTGVASDFSELVTVGGEVPVSVMALEPRGIEVVYRVESWGHHGFVVVRWTDDGFEIRAD